MYIRKFEADSLDEALKTIKSELGPDAIILKTVTNKGLKGAFKKNKIEITAAISEKNYTKKAHVDHALGEQNKEKFYQNNSSYISNMIDDYDQSQGQQQRVAASTPSGYGSVGLNRQVKQVKDIGSKIKSSLDDFLSSGVGEENKDRYVEENKESQRFEDYSDQDPLSFDRTQEAVNEKQVMEQTQNYAQIQSGSEYSAVFYSYF